MTRILFKGGRVFDGTGAPLAEADVVVEAGRILEVGTGLDGDEVVDAGGADVIKICTSGGVLSPRDSPRHAHFNMEELRACVAEARAGGLEVMAHAQVTTGSRTPSAPASARSSTASTSTTRPSR